MKKKSARTAAPVDTGGNNIKTEIAFNNRELSWMDFNMRVLEEAYKKDNPVLEKLKFLAITASNLDEFFMVRVASIKEQINSKYKQPDFSGLTPSKLFECLSEKVHDFTEKQYSCLNHSILPALKKNGLFLRKPKDLTESQRKHLNRYFHKIIFHVLTPLAVDRSRPFPVLSNKSLNLAVRLEQDGESYYAIVQVPSILPRLVEVPCSNGRTFVLLEDVIVMNLNQLFELYKIKATTAFRLTRNADLAIDEEAADLLVEIQKSIKKRKRGKPVRLEIDHKCDGETLAYLVERLKVHKSDIYEGKGPIDLTFWMKFSGLDGRDDLRFPPIVPALAAGFVGKDDLFSAIRERDIMVHHPYESFTPVVDFVRQAARDPNVLAIKQTLYRVSGNSPIIAALENAAERGKQVTVLVELKARFDEENNIHWAKALEDAGCHVIYGLTGLKTHCKVLLIVRREEEGLRRYLHMGTGNYNDSTAKLYTDIGLFTCQEDFCSDASSLFNTLTGYSRPPEYKKMIVAPHAMRAFFLRKIGRETKNSLEGRPAGITIKVNALLDPQIVEALYGASKAGVQVKLIVRGICSLVPGLVGISENITVISLVGQLLEHSRIFLFENAGKPKLYMGSADLMPRNLDRRVEMCFPVEDETLFQEAIGMIDLFLRDTVNARMQRPDTTYVPVDRRGKPQVNCHTEFSRRAHRREKERLTELEKEKESV